MTQPTHLPATAPSATKALLRAALSSTKGASSGQDAPSLHERRLAGQEAAEQLRASPKPR